MSEFLKEVCQFREDVPELADDVKVSGDGRVAMGPDAARAFQHWRETHRPVRQEGQHGQ